MPASNLIETVAEVISGGREEAPAEVRPDLDQLLQRLRDPVRVAVVGPVKSGKSTIVNALLGQRVAPTDVSECTRLVSWFHYGRPQRVEVQAKDGRTLTTQLESDGTLPRQLPVPPEEVRSLHCYLANDLLRLVTLIDTPGIGSVHGDYSRSTSDLLSSTGDTADAAGQADAVVFLFSQVMMEDDLQALQLFRNSPTGETERSAANAVGVLSKADQLGDGSGDTWNLAVELATSYAGRFRDDVATVVPVIGLLAETAETATLTETDANRLQQLAGMDEKSFARLLWSVDRFVSGEAPVEPAHRERLITLLDLYGIERAVRLLRDGMVGAVSLRRELSSLSGIAQIKATLETYFREQDHVLKVRSVLDAVERLTFGDARHPASPALEKLRGEIEGLRLDPVMHPVSELEAWHECCSGRVEFPAEVMEEIGRLFRPGTVAGRLGVDDDHQAMVDAAREGMIRWQKFMVAEATPAQTKVGRVVRRSYQIIWTGLQPSEVSG